MRVQSGSKWDESLGMDLQWNSFDNWNNYCLKVYLFVAFLFLLLQESQSS